MIWFNNVVKKHQISTLLYLGLVLTLIMPSIAPWINPDFAAFQPTHDHVYLGKVNIDHHTSPNISNLPHNAIPHPHPEPKIESTENDIIFLPDNNYQLNLLTLCCPDTMLHFHRLDTFGTMTFIPLLKAESVSYPPSTPPPKFNLF